MHQNELVLNLQEPPETRRLRKRLPIDLPTTAVIVNIVFKV
jgi:hypothetical protein